MEPNLKKKEKIINQVVNREKKILIISICCILTLLLSSSYALLSNFSKSEEIITFKTGNLEISILNGEETFSLINLNNKYPESDEEGLINSEAIPITLKNTGTILIGDYKVKLVSETGTENNSTLNEEYIRYSISLDNITYSSPSSLTDNDNIIYKGTDLEVGESKTIYLKIWLSSNSKNDAIKTKYFGTLSIDLVQDYKILIPKISDVSLNDDGRISFNISYEDNDLMYCVNQKQEDVADCTWYTGVLGVQTTEDYVTKSGIYYIHVKNQEEKIGHSEGIEINLTYNVLDYIETTGTQYINTEFNPSPTTTKVETLFQVTNNSVKTQGLFGSRGLTNNADTTSVNIFYNVSSNNLRVDWLGNTTTSVSVSLNTDIEMICENNLVTINGTNYTSSVTKSTTYLTYPIYIGNFNNAGVAYTNGSYSRFKYFKIYDNKTLVRDFIPVERISDGVIGLYDKVNNKLYENIGTGTFTKGTIVGVME